MRAISPNVMEDELRLGACFEHTESKEIYMLLGFALDVSDHTGVRRLVLYRQPGYVLDGILARDEQEFFGVLPDGRRRFVPVPGDTDTKPTNIHVGEE